MSLLIRFYQRTIEDTINIMTLVMQSLWLFFRNVTKGRKQVHEEIVKQINSIGIRGLLVIGFSGMIMGIILIVIANSIINQLPLPPVFVTGAQSNLLINILIKELGPLLTAIIIIGKSGTSMTTEIGNMQVNHEIEALEMLGIDHLYYVVAPRIIGSVFAVVALTIYFNVVGVVGGFIVSAGLLGIGQAFFFEEFFTWLEISHIVEFLIKSFGFGLIIGGTACYNGYKVQMSITEVPRYTGQTVVQAMVLCFVFYGYITVMAL